MSNTDSNDQSFIGPRMNDTASPPVATPVAPTDLPPAYTRHLSQGTSKRARTAHPAEQPVDNEQPAVMDNAQPAADESQRPSEANAGPFNNEQNDFVRQLLREQRESLDRQWQRRVETAQHQTHVSLRAQYDQQMSAINTGAKRHAPLFSSVPCSALKYPGPNKHSDEYKNYLTLLQGELGLNSAMENLLNAVIPHPIGGNPEMRERLEAFFEDQLHKPEWVFDPKKTGHTISVVRRSKPAYADELLTAMNNVNGRRHGEGYMQLNKCLYMAVHRTCEPVKRDKSLLSSSEHGTHEHVWNGMGVFNTIKALSLGENGTDLSLRRTELIDELRQITYVPGVLGISDMFERIADARNELEGMEPATNFDDATILSYVHRELESKHALFTEAKEIIENNFDANKLPTTTKSAQRVHERFEKRLVRLLRADPNPTRNFPNLDLKNITVKQAKVKRVKVKSVDIHKQKRNREPKQALAQDDDDDDIKRTRGDKHCVWHPKSKRGLHDTSECKNPYSKNSLWADQGNQFLTNRDWRERQEKGHGPPKRTHGRCPVTGAGPDSTATNPPLLPSQRDVNQQQHQHGKYQQQPVPPHLAVHAAQYQQPVYTAPVYYPPAQQQPSRQQWVLQDVVPPQQQQPQEQFQPTAIPQQRAQQFRTQHYSRPPQEGPMPTHQVRAPQQLGWDPRTTPVNQINARVPVAVQPVDGIRTVLNNARRYGTQPSYPTRTQTQNFGRGGSFSRRI
jgi:hypothetical protein